MKDTIGASSLDDIAEALADPTIIMDMQRDLKRKDYMLIRKALRGTSSLDGILLADGVFVTGMPSI